MSFVHWHSYLTLLVNLLFGQLSLWYTTRKSWYLGITHPMFGQAVKPAQRQKVILMAWCNSSALAVELLQSYTKPLIYGCLVFILILYWCAQCVSFVYQHNITRKSCSQDYSRFASSLGRHQQMRCCVTCQLIISEYMECWYCGPSDRWVFMSHRGGRGRKGHVSAHTELVKKMRDYEIWVK